MRRIKHVSDRRGGDQPGLVATCEICGTRSGAASVPFVLDYWSKYHDDDERDGERVYRCQKHEPGKVEGDALELQE